MPAAIVTSFRFHSALASVALLACSGCATLRLNVLRSSAARPSQVAAYFTTERVATNQGVGGLPAERFVIYEDGVAVPPLEARATLLDPSAVAAHYTVVLVDAGGSVSRAGLLPSITAGVRSFVARAGDRQRIAVFAFDGESVPRTVAARARPADVLPQLDALATMQPRDSSTNLNGALVWALQHLDRELAGASQPLKFGTVVLFTATRDIANRVTAASLNDALSVTSHEVYAAGVGRDVDARLLAGLGRTQSFYDADPSHAQRVLDLAADRVAARAARHYFLSYCSPLRADRHRVRVEAREEGGAFGGAEFEIDATGFRAGCDPTGVPSWGQRAEEPPQPPPASDAAATAATAPNANP
jgi:hypothetical protein